MAGVHALIGLGEGVITALVLAAFARARPELLEPGGDRDVVRPVAAYGAVIAVALALFASPLASRWPDGLDRTAEVLGFGEKAAAPVLAAPIPEYEMPGIAGSALATSLAGVAGTLVVLALSWLVARVLVPRAQAAVAGGRPWSTTSSIATAG